MSGNGSNKADGERGAGVDHGWGDLRTWVIIIGLSAALVITTLIIYALIGKHTLQHWNLGYPPTAPGLIAPLFAAFRLP
jgi:hypothetical protein